MPLWKQGGIKYIVLIALVVIAVIFFNKCQPNYDDYGGDECPKCKGTNIGTYFYGYYKPGFVDSVTLEKIEKGVLIPGGCFVSSKSPEYRCNDCFFRWGKYWHNVNDYSDSDTDSVNQVYTLYPDTFESVQQFHTKMESTKMLKYIDPEVNIKVLYPDFFDSADNTEGSARFYYPDSLNWEISLTMYVNGGRYCTKEAIEHFSNSFTTCLAKGDDFFILYGKVDENARTKFLEKYFLVDGKWIEYSLFYRTRLEGGCTRLMSVIIDWDPRK